MREPYWRFFNDKELEEWFDMWEQQLYYEEKICSLNKQESYEYGADETKKISQKHTETRSVVGNDGNEEDDPKCTM